MQVHKSIFNGLFMQHALQGSRLGLQSRYNTFGYELQVSLSVQEFHVSVGVCYS